MTESGFDGQTLLQGEHISAYLILDQRQYFFRFEQCCGIRKYFFGSGSAGIMAPDTRELLISDPAGSVSIRIRYSELWIRIHEANLLRIHRIWIHNTGFDLIKT